MELLTRITQAVLLTAAIVDAIKGKTDSAFIKLILINVL
jgi:hypothetical protein